MNKKLNSLSSFLCREGGRTLPPLPETERGLLISTLAPTHSSARDLNPWLIAKVLLHRTKCFLYNDFSPL
jgi:hypothetical protein